MSTVRLPGARIRQPHTFRVVVAAGMAVALVALGGCTTVMTQTPNSSTTSRPTQVLGEEPTPQVSPDSGTSPSPLSSGATVRAYFFLGSFTHPAGLAPVLRESDFTPAMATAAMNALLEGPASAEVNASPAMYTTIPAGTRLLGLTIANGVATVNLSREFESGGGSASVLGRLGQVVFTLTQFPTVDSVAFELDGQPVTVFSGEGVVLDHPVGRSDFADQLPAIWVDEPAWGAAIGNPARIVGMANVFEAT
ncbi:MAG: GerMN domain-containing protein, partial [Chloroflexota bacterium]